MKVNMKTLMGELEDRQGTTSQCGVEIGGQVTMLALLTDSGGRRCTEICVRSKLPVSIRVIDYELMAKSPNVTFTIWHIA
jgi:hypothetical protein